MTADLERRLAEGPPPRCGDHVYHHPTEEHWVVAYVRGRYLGWCGWPGGEAPVADCMVTKRCTDEEHEALLVQIVFGGTGDLRGARAAEDLAALRSRRAGGGDND